MGENCIPRPCSWESYLLGDQVRNQKLGQRGPTQQQEHVLRRWNSTQQGSAETWKTRGWKRQNTTCYAYFNKKCAKYVSMWEKIGREYVKIRRVNSGRWDVRECEKFKHVSLSLKFHCFYGEQTRLILSAHHLGSTLSSHLPQAGLQPYVRSPVPQPQGSVSQWDVHLSQEQPPPQQSKCHRAPDNLLGTFLVAFHPSTSGE